MQAVRSVGLDRLKRFVCLLLIFVLLFCFFLAPRAQAVALEATTIAYGGLLVGTILVGAGVVFSSHGDMVKVGNAMYKTLVNGSSAIGKTISSISAWAVEHGASLAKGALRVGKDMYQSIVDAFNASYSSGRFMFDTDVSKITDSNVGVFRSAFNQKLIKNCTVSIDGHIYDFFASRDAAKGILVYSAVDGGESTLFCQQPWGNFNGGSSVVSDYGVYLDYDKMYHEFSVGIGYIANGGFSGCGIVDLGSLPAIVSPSVPLPDSIVVPTPDIAYPSDDYLVKMPDIPAVDSATGEVTYPDSNAYTKDAVAVPYPVDTEGVKVPDIPYDKVVDQSTGKALDDTGTDTDNPSKPGEGTDTDNPSDSVNWPSAGDISLPKLIISKFPFCIPFDVARLIGLLEAEPKTPIFHVPLKVGTILDEEIVLDLSQWDNAVRIIRWGELIVFVAGLVLVTRNYIKW